ncbi:MAG: hypothetical protein AAF485_23225 [Chloroflexota bacterium]
MLNLLLLAHAGVTLYMMGLIWFVQVVHYTLFNRIGSNVFTTYEQAHTQLTTLVVGPPMLLEAATTGLLLIVRPTDVSLVQAGIGAFLLAIIWLSTMFLQVPQHGILSNGFDQAAYQFLVNSNWIRTIAWSARGFLALWMISSVMK